MSDRGPCTVDECEHRAWARGMCNTHLNRLWRTGSVHLVAPPTTSERFHAKVTQGDGSCLVWTGHIMRNGYGMFYPPDRKVPAHRFAYEDAFGAIPDGMHIDHLCRNRACVNPAHLEPVTQAENNRRAGAVRRENAAARC